MVKGIRHTGIVVKNMRKSLEFWTDLGFVVHKTADENSQFMDAVLGLEHTRLHTVKLRAPSGQIIELLHFASHRDKVRHATRPYSEGITHIAMTVDKLDKGVISPDGAVKITYIQAPDNVLL